MLSFCYEHTIQKIEGEIIFCLDVIKRNAKKDGIATNEELRKNIIHSTLHIVGYQHGNEMFALQNNIL